MDTADLETFQGERTLHQLPRAGQLWQTNDGMNHQQGHMECLMCHADHTKSSAK
jgi:hypothetical protein